jgi:hypothetical protein
MLIHTYVSVCAQTHERARERDGEMQIERDGQRKDLGVCREVVDGRSTEAPIIVVCHAGHTNAKTRRRRDR